MGKLASKGVGVERAVRGENGRARAKERAGQACSRRGKPITVAGARDGMEASARPHRGSWSARFGVSSYAQWAGMGRA